MGQNSVFLKEYEEFEIDFKILRILFLEVFELNIRVGLGYDVHRFAENRKLVIGGVCIPYEMGLLGHSDADVLVHAVMDSIVGACKKGDIGKLFPDNDPEFKGISSLELLKRVYEIIKNDGYKVINIDSIIVAQKPKMAQYISSMEKNISKCLSIDTEAVSVKATTEEKLGFTGREEGIAAKAVCLVEKS